MFPSWDPELKPHGRPPPPPLYPAACAAPPGTLNSAPCSCFLASSPSLRTYCWCIRPVPGFESSRQKEREREREKEEGREREGRHHTAKSGLSFEVSWGRVWKTLLWLNQTCGAAPPAAMMLSRDSVDKLLHINNALSHEAHSIVQVMCAKWEVKAWNWAVCGAEHVQIWSHGCHFAVRHVWIMYFASRLPVSSLFCIILYIADQYRRHPNDEREGTHAGLCSKQVLNQIMFSIPQSSHLFASTTALLALGILSVRFMRWSPGMVLQPVLKELPEVLSARWPLCLRSAVQLISEAIPVGSRLGDRAKFDLRNVDKNITRRLILSTWCRHSPATSPLLVWNEAGGCPEDGVAPAVTPTVQWNRWH